VWLVVGHHFPSNALLYLNLLALQSCGFADIMNQGYVCALRKEKKLLWMNEKQVGMPRNSVR
jgi:hypothetical protein